MTTAPSEAVAADTKEAKAAKKVTAAAPKAADTTPATTASDTPSETKKATSKGTKKRTTPALPPAPVISSPVPSSVRRNREREALNLYSTAMESFKKADYDQARDVLQLLLSDFSLESEIASRARTFLKICEQKLQPTVL